MNVRVENQTSNPVEYEQTGGGGPSQEQGEDSTRGVLPPGGHAEFPPAGKAPFQVTFSQPPDVEKPERRAEVGAIGAADATVVLTGFPVVVQT